MEGHIAGNVELTGSEWEGNLCTVVFLSGCNFRCQFCYNPSLLETRSEHLRDLRRYKKFIEEQSAFADALLFAGGEPTLQRQSLITLAKWAKEQGMLVGVETNGSRPTVLRYMLNEGLLDHIILGLNSPLEEEIFGKVAKPPAFFKSLSEVVMEVKQTIKLLHQSKASIVVRTTIVPNLMYRREHLLAIADLIKDLRCIWEIRPFVPQKPLVSRQYEEIKSPSEDFLFDLKKHCQVHYPLMDIRIKCPIGYLEEPVQI